jgi:hypothetical protein
MAIALRGYADDGRFVLAQNLSPRISPSRWAVVFDTETRTDAGQALRFGTYQVREGGRLHEAGIFYNPETLTPKEIAVIESVATAFNLTMLTAPEFIENVFFKYGYDREGTIVGFNLPFDISRIAIRHGSARCSMRGGFTFLLSPCRWRPSIQVKHLNSRSALMRFTVPGKQLRGRGMRRRGIAVAPNRGCFDDVRTFAAALTSASHNLASLSKLLGTEHRKLETDEHGILLTKEYVRYAIQDVQVTWECYCELLNRL